MIKYLNTNIQYHQTFDSISDELGFIKGITIVKEGEAKGHNLFINSKFLDDVVRFGNERTAGIKARFGHPNICSSALGTYLGRYKNFRKIDDKVLADLFLDASAKTSPKGNLYEYVLQLARTNPDMFGASISFKRGESTFESFQSDGKEQRREYASITDLYATDLVDDPAATDGLFEAFQHDDLSSQVTQFLDSHPELFNLIDKQPDLISDFIIKYNNYKNHNSMNITEEFNNLKTWLKENFSSKSKPDNFESQVNEKLNEFEKLISTQSDFEKQKEALDTKISELTISNKSLEDKILGLENKVSELEAGPTSLDVVADPNLNISKPTDKAGKELLMSIPIDGLRKLKAQSNKVSQSKSE
jgi:hypothetical protein